MSGCRRSILPGFLTRRLNICDSRSVILQFWPDCDNRKKTDIIGFPIINTALEPGRRFVFPPHRQKGRLEPLLGGRFWRIIF